MANANHSTGIYQILNRTNSKAYVGSAVNLTRRWKRHRTDLRCGRHHSSALQNAWDKYGEGVFEFTVLLICSPDNLIFYEQRCIDALKPEYNISPTAGSNRGFKQSPEAKAKISASLAGHPVSEEARAKISAGNLGRIASPETLARMSAARTGGKRSPETKEKMSAAQRTRFEREKESGVVRLVAPETRAKLSASGTGRQHSPEARAKIRAARTGKVASPETLARMSAANIGRIMPPANLAKLIAANTGRACSPETKAKISASRRAHYAKKREAKALSTTAPQQTTPNPGRASLFADAELYGQGCHPGRGDNAERFSVAGPL